MTQRTKNPLTEMYGDEFPVPTFRTGEVAQILDIPIWRLQKFLESKQYQLTPEDEMGKGFHRRFRVEDIYRLAIASRLVQDGFAAPFIGEMLQQLDNSDFRLQYDDEGNDLPLKFLAFRRTTKGPQLVWFRSMGGIRFGEKGSPYYLLDLGELTDTVNARLKKVSEQW